MLICGWESCRELGQRDMRLVYRYVIASNAERSSLHEHRVSDLGVPRPIMLTYCDHGS
jgi:hypothetical protein